MAEFWNLTGSWRDCAGAVAGSACQPGVDFACQGVQDQLDLVPSGDDNRRVLAVLAYLDS
jgi:hypothetical protein